MNQIILDEKIAARSVKFGILTQLIKRLERLRSFTYSEIVDHPARELEQVLRTESGAALGRTSRYRFFYALKSLGLISQSMAGYTLSEEGREVAETAGGADPGQGLPEEVLAVYRRVVRSCEVVRRNFLVLFTGDVRLDPWEQGVPFSFLPVPNSRQYDLRSRLWSGALILSERQTQGVLWGLRQWCQTVGLIDEMVIRPQADVPVTDANILFPVKPELRRTMTLSQFDSLLRKELESLAPAYGDTAAISIPLLLYRMCPRARLPVRTAQSLLAKWLAHNREHAFVEAPSFAILESSRLHRGVSLEVWRKQQEGFLQIGNRVYSRLFVTLARR